MESTITPADNVMRCPFCRRKLVLVHEKWTNRNGHTCEGMYYMHEEYDIYKEESCLLDELKEPLHIGAGDARDGYIGEYAEKWNKSLSTYEAEIKNKVICEFVNRLNKDTTLDGGFREHAREILKQMRKER
jgi:uncharacterized protein YbaR (Trm112 family)